MLNHHPSIEMLTDYAAGSLALSHSLCIAAHLEHCPECQQQVQKLEILGAHFFDQVPQESSRLDKLKDTFFERLEKQPTIQKNTPLADHAENSTLWDKYKVPYSLRQFITKSYDELTWMRLSPSFKIAILHNEEGGPQVSLTRVKAGAHMPTHTHTGDEITLVLEGAFSDEQGVYRRGDFINRDASHKHKPIVTKDAECICLTVLDAPIEFTGWFARLFNPILRRYHPHSP
ncbi:ChrR family anti-sigma-E factor [Marinomonas transparens]|uniref:Cupin domain-containing protein n=1 Tax=Marinomonas transparens TaxID=2795388 RepID=A0A934JVF1_9GAMM|nr:ChrR family anti-sigma-E factor [Marinomonas transparens]MBJ7538025.1 cupin domain-containing protein [Marinomonas transparens]